MLSTLARAATRRPLTVMLLWGVFLLLGFGLGTGVFGKLSDDVPDVPGTESQVAARVAAARGARSTLVVAASPMWLGHADRVVWACGAWLPELFDGLPITVTKQDTLHFAAPPQWSLPETPAWVDHGASAYGHGDVDGVGMKATSDAEGPPYEPEHGPEEERCGHPGFLHRL